MTSRHDREKKETEDELLRELKTSRKKASTLEVCEIERDEIQSELKKNEDDVNALLNATPGIVFLMDKDGVILAANESAARAYHTTVKELARHLRLRPDPTRARPCQTRDEKHSEAGRLRPTAVRFEMEWKGRFLDHSLYNVRDEKRQVTKVAVYVRHVAALRRQMEAELQRAEEKVQKDLRECNRGDLPVDPRRALHQRQPVLCPDASAFDSPGGVACGR